MPPLERFDVIVVGAGHAGIEAALASARMGRRTLCLTLRADRIGHLPCNCSIGGPAKGHLAREVDALGGQMAVTADRTLTHLRRVGTGKGPSVQTLRLQVCKDAYPLEMQRILAAEPLLEVREGQAIAPILMGGRIAGLRTDQGDLASAALVLTTGTFLNGLCHEGKRQTVAARQGDAAVADLGDALRALGFRTRRFKTGTTPRLDRRTIDFDRLPALPSEPDAGPLSFAHAQLPTTGPLLPTWTTRTTPETHALIREHLHESAMYGGTIEGVGPRFCPSIEDKIVRFADKESHPVHLEQETWTGDSIYLQGVSTSLPAEVQARLVRTLPGLASAEMIRPGYAVEYDMVDPRQLDPSLMARELPGLFLAGQVNGTSGYEEAAAQGIAAGLNAARYALAEPPVPFPRHESFLGVLIDDLVTKGVDAPYRMLTSRAEHRLVLRHDNADQRLTPLGRSLGLVDDARWDRYQRKMEAVADGLDRLRSVTLTSQQQPAADRAGLGPIHERVSLYQILRRPELDLADVERLAEDAGLAIEIDPSRDVREQIELEAKYDGYIERQRREVQRMSHLESLRLPDACRFEQVAGLSHESVEKLSLTRPATIGQASRIPGVRPSDIALLIGHLRQGTLPR